MDTAFLFADRLHTNYAPSAEEIKSITETINIQDRELAKLESEMNQALASFKELEERYLTLWQDTDDKRALVSPMRQLPIDLLREIFIRCLPSAHNALMTQQKCPLLLTRVCSGWRSIALSTPQLWSSVHIPMPINIRNKETTQFAMEWAAARAAPLRQWLQRAGSLPLSVSISDPGNTSGPLHATNSPSEPLFAVIKEFSQFWGDLSIVPSFYLLQPLSGICSKDVPLLCTLSVNALHVVNDELPKLALFTAPNLRRLTLTIYQDPTKFDCTWSNLTHLTIRGKTTPGFQPSSIPLRGALVIFGRCTQLQSFHLEVGGAGVSKTLPMGYLYFPHLHTLGFQVGEVDLPLILNDIHTPVLESVKFHTAPKSRELESFLSFLSRSSKTLRSLNTNPCLFRQKNFLECLKSCDQLRHITFQRWRFRGSSSTFKDIGPTWKIKNDFLDFLSPPGDNADLNFLHLESLSILEPVQVSQDKLISFLQRRRRPDPMTGTPKFRHVKMTFRNREPDSVDKDLEALLADGMVADFKYRSSDVGKPYVPATQGLEDLAN